MRKQELIQFYKTSGLNSFCIAFPPPPLNAGAMGIWRWKLALKVRGVSEKVRCHHPWTTPAMMMMMMVNSFADVAGSKYRLLCGSAVRPADS